MDRKKKNFGTSGGFKKKRKLYVNNLAKFRLPSENFSNSIVPTILENISEPDMIIENETIDSVIEQIPSNNHITDDDENNSYGQIEVEINTREKVISREFPFDKNQFQIHLASWAVTNKIKHDHLRGLLKLWNDYVPLAELPADPRTILETPRKIHLQNDNYWHYGLKNALNKALHRIVNVPQKLSLKINIDGIPVSKSSNIECWPILCGIKELPRLPPCIIGIYCGASTI